MPFLDMPAYELLDQALDACDIFEWADEPFIESLFMLAVQGQFEQVKRVLEAQLMSALCQPYGNFDALLEGFLALSESPEIKCSELAKSLGVSDRHLRSCIKNAIGHSPKQAMKIRRFSKSLSLVNSGYDWSTIAYLSGYYDQSHMIGDYQEMVGESPQRLFHNC